MINVPKLAKTHYMMRPECRQFKIYVNMYIAGLSGLAYLYPAHDCKHWYSRRFWQTKRYICIPKDVFRLFLEKRYMVPYYSQKNNYCRTFNKDSYNSNMPNYYSMGEVELILGKIDELIWMLEENCTNPLLKEILDEEMLFYCSDSLGMPSYIIEQSIYMNESDRKNYVITHSEAIIKFYKHFSVQIREMFKIEANKKYLCVVEI